MKRIITLLLIAMILVPWFSIFVAANASLTPTTLATALKPGESTTETVSVFLPGKIPTADVIFAFDMTGSMSAAIATAKSQALNIMNSLDTLISDAHYGVISFMDYPWFYSSYGYSEQYGSSPDYAYRLDQTITSDRTSVSNAINALEIGNGADGPQDYTRIMYESYADPAVSWRPGTKRILILLCDSVPHDDNLNEGFTSGTWSTGGDPGRDEVMFTSDDLDLQTVLAAMASNDVALLVVSYGGSSYLDYWGYWAGLTGGSVYLSSSASSVPSAIVSLVGGVAAHVNKLTLKAEVGYEDWLTSVTPSEYLSIDIPPVGVTKVFEASITVPLGTLPGTYKFHLIADADGASYGEQEVTITCLGGAVDSEPPVIQNVRHEPLYPTFYDTIYFYADVTDNVAVAKVQLNYTLDGGVTWLLKDMLLSEGNTYSASLGPYDQFQIVGFYVIAYDTSGNKAYGSEIVPPLPEAPKAAPIVVSDQPSNPIPSGKDIGYNTTDTGTQIIANVSELGLYGSGLTYTISYSLDGGMTWVVAGMNYLGDFIWNYIVPSLTNILFKVVASDGSSSKVYWIIVGPWKYPIYLYFSTAEEYFPVKGLDFDGDNDVSNNWASYRDSSGKYIDEFLSNDIDQDGTHDVWSYTYMKPKTLDDGCLVIEYWIYYAFNHYPILDQVFRDDHEHDFESVYIWVDLATGHIKKLACSQHKWVNHYLFDVNNPPKAINLAVENGGHGMALLKDGDNDGFPDVNALGSYIILPGVSWLGLQEGPMPFRDFLTIKPGSFRAQLYPWVIYDPRIDLSKLHLFSDLSTLTNGLALDVLAPMLPAVINDIPQYYGYLGDLLGVNCVLKTSFGVSGRDDYKMVFAVVSPLYRQEFDEPARFWRKVSFGWWPVKEAAGFIANLVTKGLFSYFKLAIIAGVLSGKAAELVTKYVLKAYVDAVQSVVIDSKGRTLGYSEVVNDLPLGIALATRDMTDDLYDLYLIMTNSSSEYTYEIIGIEPFVAYNLTVSLMDSDFHEFTFNATMIPIHAGEVHRYVINWTLLENGESGVQVSVDLNGDGVAEQKFRSNGDLTAKEFEQATADEIPPTTMLATGNPEYTDSAGKKYITSATPLTLTAEDNVGGTGVASTGYRIRSATHDFGGATSTPPIQFYMTGFADGTYFIDYNSTDVIGNIEPTNTATVILDNTPPTTNLNIGDPKYVSGRTYVTPDTPFTLTAADASSGLKLTTYRINSTSYNTGWLTYTNPFKLSSLPDGNYTITFNSTDNVGNVETTNRMDVTLFSWNYVFKDSDGRGTTLKICTACKFFQFIAPDKDFGIKYASKMIQLCKEVVISCYEDGQMRLMATAMDNTNCLAMVYDKQTCKTYWLFECPPTYTLTVFCKDASGKAVSSAWVYVNGCCDGWTDSNGKLVITHVLAGTYTVTVKKCGYKDSTCTTTVTGNATLTITMTPQTYTLTVFCKDSKGKSVSGANVYLNGNLKGATDSNGKLAIINLSAGTFSLTVKKSGYKDTSISVTISGDKTITITMTT